MYLGITNTIQDNQIILRARPENFTINLEIKVKISIMNVESLLVDGDDHLLPPDPDLDVLHQWILG